MRLVLPVYFIALFYLLSLSRASGSMMYWLSIWETGSFLLWLDAA